MRRTLLLLPLLCCFGTWSCNQAGKLVAGGPGDPLLYEQVPPVPSPPVVLGIYHVLCTDITTNPSGASFSVVPSRFDRYQALNDTTTISIAAGPSSNTITVKGVYLDPRIDDSLLLQDRGNGLWVGRGGFGPTAYSIEILTDGAGAVLDYIVQLVTTSTAGTNIATRRTFQPVPPPSILSPGLKLAIVGSCSKPPPNTGDPFNMIIRADGLCQWEQDTFEQKYYFNPLTLRNEAQATNYFSAKNPANVEFFDWLNIFITAGVNRETEHSGGAVDRTVNFLPPGGGIGGIDDSGEWEGKTINPSGVFQSTPYILRNQQSDALMKVQDAALTLTVQAGGIWDQATTSMSGGRTDLFQIIRLEANKLIAVHWIDKYSYDLFTLIRDEPAGAVLLTPHTVSGDNKTFTIQRFTNGVQLGSYSVGSAVGFPLSWYP